MNNEETEDYLRQQELNDLNSVASTDAGLRVLARLICRCMVFTTVNTADHSQARYIEGQRRIGLHHLELLRRAGSVDKVLVTAIHLNEDIK